MGMTFASAAIELGESDDDDSALFESERPSSVRAAQLLSVKR